MSQAINRKKKKSHMIKVAMVGDPQIGKTSLMVKYVEGKFNEDYIQTLGVNFMEKTIELKTAEITFSIWDLGGQREYMEMMPLVCNEAVALLFMFDLSRPATLASVRQWYMEARKLNQTATAFLIGTKYDYFATMQLSHKQEMTKQARKFAKAMKASLVFCSASKSINIAKIFKIVLASRFRLPCKVANIKKVGEPILEYVEPPPKKTSSKSSSLKATRKSSSLKSATGKSSSMKSASSKSSSLKSTK